MVIGIELSREFITDLLEKMGDDGDPAAFLVGRPGERRRLSRDCYAPIAARLRELTEGTEGWDDSRASRLAAMLESVSQPENTNEIELRFT